MQRPLHMKKSLQKNSEGLYLKKGMRLNMQTEARKADKNIKVLLNEVENSIKSIYQSIEKIEYVDSKMSQNFKDRLLRLSMKKNEMQPEEMLVEVMSIQRELIEFLDTDKYKQATLHPQDEKKTLREKENEENKYPTVVPKQKKSFWKKRRKTNEEITSDLENTPTISQIAYMRNENVDKIDPFIIVDEDGFQEDFRYLTYEKLGNIRQLSTLKYLKEKRIKIVLDDNNFLYNEWSCYFQFVSNGLEGMIPVVSDLDKGINFYAFIKILLFAEFLGGEKEIEFKLELLNILRSFPRYYLSSSIPKKDIRNFKEKMEDNNLYIYYRNMYKKAIEEYELTFKDFYYQRDKNRMRYKKDIRNQVKIENSEEHVDSQESDRVYQQEKTKDRKAFMDNLSEVPR